MSITDAFRPDRKVAIETPFDLGPMGIRENAIAPGAGVREIG